MTDSGTFRSDLVVVQEKRATLDAVSLTIYWNKLLAIVDEANATLVRTAFSRTVTDGWDFSCALFDASGELVAQGRHGLPAFVACLSLAVKDFMRAYPPERVQPGDSLITTDPWIGASQINDVFFVTPVFCRDRVVAYAANVAHSPDVGGRVLSADSTEIFEEGFRLPIVKLFDRGEPNEDLFRIIRMNVRVPDIVVGDLLAQLAANTIMARRVVEFLQERQLDDLDELSAAILARSEAAMRQAIGRIPPGTYHGEIETDGFDEPLTLKCALNVTDSDIFTDFTGSSPQDDHGVNCTGRYTYAEMAHALISVARPSSPVNGATLRPIHFYAPEGTVINASYPAALGSRILVAMFVHALMFQTLAQAAPDRVIADPHSPPAVPCFSGVWHNGRRYVELIRVNGGLGARPTMDGISAVGWSGNISTVPVELTENETPMLLLRRELVQDSGGAGRYRGGLGQYFVWRSYARQPATIGVRLDRVKHPPQGLFGGLAGAPAAVMMNGQAIHPKKTVRLADGDVFHIQSAGSGGYGDPLDRDPLAVLDDVLDGYISPEQARRDYRVVVDLSRKAIDWDATRQLREEV